MCDAHVVHSPAKPPIARACWVMLTLSLATLMASLFASGDVLTLCAFGGWLPAVTMVVLAGLHLVRRGGGRLAAWFALILATLLLIGQTSIACRTGRLVAHVIDNRADAEVRTRHLGRAIQQYADTAGHYPESLTRLVNTDLVPPKNLVAPLDPGFDRRYSYADWPRDLIYSSYVYQPGKGSWQNDSRIVLAYEYDAWYPTRLQLFPEYARCVLFGDARVDLLDSEAFNRALRDDAVRRKELGWPRHTTRPVGGPTATTTRRATE